MLNKLKKSFIYKPLVGLVFLSFFLMSFRINGAGEVVLQNSTPITLKSLNEINSDLLNVGDVVHFAVAYDVKVDNKVVIQAGSTVNASVTRAERSKGIGKPGEFDIQLKDVKSVDGQIINLGGKSIFRQGDNKATLSIVLGVVVCLLFLLIKGKPAIIPAGYNVEANIIGNYNIKL